MRVSLPFKSIGNLQRLHIVAYFSVRNAAEYQAPRRVHRSRARAHQLDVGLLAVNGKAADLRQLLEARPGTLRDAQVAIDPLQQAVWPAAVPSACRIPRVDHVRQAIKSCAELRRNKLLCIKSMWEVCYGGSQLKQSGLLPPEVSPRRVVQCVDLL